METAIKKDLKTFLDSWRKNNEERLRSETRDAFTLFFVEFDGFYIELQYPEGRPSPLNNGEPVIIKIFKMPEKKLSYLGIEFEYKIVEVLENAEPDMNKIIDRLNNA